MPDAHVVRRSEPAVRAGLDHTNGRPVAPYDLDRSVPRCVVDDDYFVIDAGWSWWLAAFLASPRTEVEVAEAFHLEIAQTTAWLQRAVDDGLVRTSGNPPRYERIDAADDAQGSLFEP